MSYQSLKGVRVVDLGIVTAGASTSAWLADLGAEVIKVEGPAYTDPFREWTAVDPDSEWWNESPQFQATNRNKRSVCLDLKSEVGHALFMQLVAKADVVLENFRCGVLARLGIGFEALAAVNPRIILASISSQGQTGPECSKSSFGSTLEASSGMASLMRYPGGRPQITGRGMNYPDQVASMFSASAVIAALLERRRSGKAMALDLSQRELTAFLIGEQLVAAGAASSAPTAATVVEDGLVEGVFEANDRQWVAATLTRSFPTARGGDGIPRDSTGLGHWIAALPASDAAARLRAAGAAAEVLWSARDFDDAGAVPLPAAFALDTEGRQVKGLPLRLGGLDVGPFISAPALGHDNAAVAEELLGVDAGRFAELSAAAVFSTIPAKAAKPLAKRS